MKWIHKRGYLVCSSSKIRHTDLSELLQADGILGFLQHTLDYLLCSFPCRVRWNWKGIRGVKAQISKANETNSTCHMHVHDLKNVQGVMKRDSHREGQCVYLHHQLKTQWFAAGGNTESVKTKIGSRTWDGESSDLDVGAPVQHHRSNIWVSRFDGNLKCLMRKRQQPVRAGWNLIDFLELLQSRPDSLWLQRRTRLDRPHLRMRDGIRSTTFTQDSSYFLQKMI